MLFGLSRGPPGVKAPQKYGDRDFTSEGPAQETATKAVTGTQPQTETSQLPSLRGAGRAGNSPPITSLTGKSHSPPPPGFPNSRPPRPQHTNRSPGPKANPISNSMRSTSAEETSGELMEESVLSFDPSPKSSAAKRPQSISKVYDYLDGDGAIELATQPPKPQSAPHTKKNPRQNRIRQGASDASPTPELITVRKHHEAIKKIKDAYEKQLAEERAKTLKREKKLEAEKQQEVERHRAEAHESVQDLQVRMTAYQKQHADHDVDVQGYKIRIADLQREIENMKTNLTDTHVQKEVEVAKKEVEVANKEVEVASLQTTIQQQQSTFSVLTEEFDRGLETVVAEELGDKMVVNPTALAEVEALRTELEYQDVDRKQMQKQINEITVERDKLKEYLKQYQDDDTKQMQKQIHEITVERDKLKEYLKHLQESQSQFKERTEQRIKEYEDERASYRRQLDAQERTATEEMYKVSREHEAALERKQSLEAKWEEEKKKLEEERQRRYSIQNKWEKDKFALEEERQRKASLMTKVGMQQQRDLDTQEEDILIHCSSGGSIGSSQIAKETSAWMVDAAVSGVDPDERRDKSVEASLDGTYQAVEYSISAVDTIFKNVVEEVDKQAHLNYPNEEVGMVHCPSASDVSDGSSRAAMQASAKLIDTTIGQLLEEAVRSDRETPGMEEASVVGSMSTVDCYSPSLESEVLMTAKETASASINTGVKAIEEAEQSRTRAYSNEERELAEYNAKLEQEIEKVRQLKQEELAAIRIQCAQRTKAAKREVQRLREELRREQEAGKKSLEDARRRSKDLPENLREEEIARETREHEEKIKRIQAELAQQIKEEERLRHEELRQQSDSREEEIKLIQKAKEQEMEAKEKEIEDKHTKKWQMKFEDSHAQFASTTAKLKGELEGKEALVQQLSDQLAEERRAHAKKLQERDAECMKTLVGQQAGHSIKESQWAQRMLEQLDDQSQRLDAKDKELVNLKSEAKKELADWMKQVNNVKEERTVLQKRLTQLSGSIRNEMEHERIQKERTGMMLEDQRSHLLALHQANVYQADELVSLRSMAIISTTQTTAIETQREKLETQAQDRVEATRKQVKEVSQLGMQQEVKELEAEVAKHKEIIKSLMEEQAETLVRERLDHERLAMKAEDYLSKAWEFQDYGPRLRLGQHNPVIARHLVNDLYKNISGKQEVNHWKTIARERDGLKRVLQVQHEQLQHHKTRLEPLEQELVQLKEALQKSEEEKKKLKVFSLQPTLAGQPATHGSGGKGSSAPSGDKTELKAQMSDFLKELLKGKKLKLVTEGGGTMPCTLSIAKTLTTLSLQAMYKTYNIPMSEIQHVIAGKDKPPDVWTSTPMDDLSVTILFGPAMDEQHTICFRVDSTQERDRFVNSLKVLRLSAEGQA